MRKRQVDSEFVANNNNSDLGSPKVREERIHSLIESDSIASLFPALISDTETDASSESSQTTPRFSNSIPSFFPPARSSSESSVNSEIIPTDPLLQTFKGKFSWPSGATYEGEFKSDQMEGFVTYTDSNGDTYRGSWSSNQKHGYGQRYNASGDFYDGFCMRNIFLLVAQTKIFWKIISRRRDQGDYTRTRRRIQTASFKDLIGFVDRKKAEIKIDPGDCTRARRTMRTSSFKDLIGFVDRREAEIKEILRQKRRDRLDGQSDSLSFSSL